MGSPVHISGSWKRPDFLAILQGIFYDSRFVVIFLMQDQLNLNCHLWNTNIWVTQAYTSAG